MIPRVISVSHVRDHVLYLRFSDGAEGEVDLSDELDGEIFVPLKSMEYFRKCDLDDELHTVVWPNGADFAPEFLYEKLRVPA